MTILAITAHRTRSRRFNEGDDLLAGPGAVQPVASALLAAARRQCAEMLAQAEREARDTLDAAQAAADAEIAKARAEGQGVAGRMAASRLGAARREARQLVLAARSRACDELRDRSTALLINRMATSQGQALIDYLTALVSDRAGGAARLWQVADGGWIIGAASGQRRAELDPRGLVEQSMASFAARVERL
jgi:hypothetical protein